MTKPLYRRLAALSLLSLTQFATIPGHAANNDVPVVVKIAGIPWFTAMEKGIKEAAKDTGLNAFMVGPTTADPAQQVRLVEDLVAKEVKVIAVVPNDAKALEPVFKRAQAAGIPVITHESPDQQGNTWDIEMIASQRFGVQIIYQDLSLFPNLSVAENIAFRHQVETPFRLARQQAMRKQAETVMERLKIPLPLDELVGSLPIATRQLVAICRALSAEARLVVMDEPTASLTHQEVDALLATIHGLKSHSIATVFVSHRLDEVMMIAERVTVLRDGGNVGTYWVRDIDRRRLSELITGQVFESRLKAPFLTDAAPALEVRGLTRQGQYAGVDLVVRPGEVLGITGRLGSGRTELALSLFGMNPPNAGEIRVNDKVVRLRNNCEAIRHGIAYVSEDRLSLGLVMPQSIADNTVISVLDRLTGPLGLIDAARRTQTIDHWIFQELRVKTSTADRPVQQLSGGNQQRVVLAKWLATEPRVLILDSPTVGVDIGAKAGIYQVIDALAARGLAIILISDEVEEVLHGSHRILVMLSGRITATYDPHRVSEQELLEAIHA